MFSTRSIWLASVSVLGLFSLAVLKLVWQLCRSRLLELEFRLCAHGRRQAQISQESLDTMIQQAQGVILVFQGFAGELHKADSMRQRMELTLDQADTWLNEARIRARSLASEPTDDVAFALVRACRRLFAGGTVQFSALLTGAPQLLVSSVADDVYRIGVEALTNALQHAGASRVEIEVVYEGGQFRLCVRDDGCGLNDVSLPGNGSSSLIGLNRMRRAAHRMDGKFRIWSRQAAGTEIEVVVPAAQAYCHADFVPLWIQSTLFRRALW